MVEEFLNVLSDSNFDRLLNSIFLLDPCSVSTLPSDCMKIPVAQKDVPQKVFVAIICPNFKLQQTPKTQIILQQSLLVTDGDQPSPDVQHFGLKIKTGSIKCSNLPAITCG